MQFTTVLSEFNSRLASAVAGLFPANVRPEQSTEGHLYFRSPPAEGEQHWRTHAVAELEPEVNLALAGAPPSREEEMLQVLLSNLGTQLRAKYNPNSRSAAALKVVGTLAIIAGL
jgi:hypothetical protein